MTIRLPKAISYWWCGNGWHDFEQHLCKSQDSSYSSYTTSYDFTWLQ